MSSTQTQNSICQMSSSDQARNTPQGSSITRWPELMPGSSQSGAIPSAPHGIKRNDTSTVGDRGIGLWSPKDGKASPAVEWVVQLRGGYRQWPKEEVAAIQWCLCGGLPKFVNRKALGRQNAVLGLWSVSTVRRNMSILEHAYQVGNLATVISLGKPSVATNALE